jgi:hypothetical protein
MLIIKKRGNNFFFNRSYTVFSLYVSVNYGIYKELFFLFIASPEIRRKVAVEIFSKKTVFCFFITLYCPNHDFLGKLWRLSELTVNRVSVSGQCGNYFGQFHIQ